MKARFITVERCGVDKCPYCWPDPYRETVNWCWAFLGKGQSKRKISTRVKTFPKICPLLDSE